MLLTFSPNNNKAPDMTPASINAYLVSFGRVALTEASANPDFY
jgi:hypothetical protein